MNHTSKVEAKAVMPKNGLKGAKTLSTSHLHLHLDHIHNCCYFGGDFSVSFFLGHNFFWAQAPKVDIPFLNPVHKALVD